jgi:hypothetical protein
MTKFKSLDAICEMAPHHRHFSGPDGSGPITLEQHYRSVAEIDLNPGVPDAVVASFDLARNAFLYCWFSYDLLMVSAPQALSTLEMALRLRLVPVGTKPPTLSAMIDMARSRGVLPALPDGAIDPLHALRMIRNDLMHGSNNQFDPNMTLVILERAAETINTLFRAEASHEAMP